MNALFNIGDEVVCINSSGTNGLIEGKKYKIKSMSACKCIINVSVGVPLDRRRCTNYCERCHCDPMDNFVHYRQDRFVKAEDNHQLEEQIFESLKGEKIYLS